MRTRSAWPALAFFALIAPWVLAAAPRSSTGEPPSPANDGTLAALTAIAGRGLMDSHAYDYLEELSDNIGGRVTGSPAAERAIEWGLAKMKAMGLENVHAEKFQISRGWTRVSADCEIVSPIQRRLVVDSLGWVGSTPASGAEGEIVPVNSFHLEDEVKQNATKWSGKVLIVVRKGEPPTDRRSQFGQFGPFLKAAHKAGAIAIIGGQGGSPSAGMRLTHTGALGFDSYYDIPVVSMAAEDQSQLERFLDHGQTVRLRVNIQNRVTDGPVDTANVVGEIRGTEHPEQVIVVGGHLDSWDLAQGSTDNGTGATSTLSAAEAIVTSGFRPRRTVRFVLFTGEEQGLLGSLAYVKVHKSEMANHLGDIILDFGQGPITGISVGGRKDLIPVLKQFADFAQGFGEMKLDDNPIFGTDTGPFVLAGLPGINLDQDSPEYRFTHHSGVDTFDKVKADVLIHNATYMGLLAYWIAGRPDRLAVPQPDEQTAKMLVEKGDDKFLKMEGLWPFGNLGEEKKSPPAKP